MKSHLPGIALALPLLLALATPAAAADDETLTEIVNVLRAQGLIDEDQHAELASKAAKKDAKQAWTDRFQLWGDFRGRFEAIQPERDIYDRSTGMRLQDRHRGRYRARLNLSAEVNRRATVYLRLASGGADPRSANQSFGSGVDFDTDDLRLDMAYVTLSPFPDGELPGVEGGYLALDVGKVKNPFRWKALGPDKLLFDGDITPEGATLRLKGGSGPVDLFAHGGVYVIDENSSAKDPKLAGAQLGGTIDLAERVTFGARGSLYHFFSLDDAFYVRAATGGPVGGTGGNLVDGIARRNGSIQVAETSAFFAFDVSELFPVQVFATYAHNLSARSSLVFPTASREDDAYAIGGFVGDKKRLVKLGFAFYRMEANAFPSMFIDSNILDGTPNRMGYVASVERQLLESVSVRFTGFKSRRIDGGLVHVNSGRGSDRLRGQADMIFKF